MTTTVTITRLSLLRQRLQIVWRTENWAIILASATGLRVCQATTYIRIGSSGFRSGLFIIEGGSNCSGQCLIIFTAGRTGRGRGLRGSGWGWWARWCWIVHWSSYGQSQCLVFWLRIVNDTLYIIAIRTIIGVKVGACTHFVLQQWSSHFHMGSK